MAPASSMPVPETSGVPAFSMTFDSTTFRRAARGDGLVGPKEDADLPVVADAVVPHHIVCVTMADADTVVGAVVDLVMFGDAMLHPPAPEQADAAVADDVVPDDWALGAAARMQT